MPDLNKGERSFFNKLNRRSARRKYFNRANAIGDNAVRMVTDFFLFGINDDIINHKSKYPFIDVTEYWWSIDDLDRALNAMESMK